MKSEIRTFVLPVAQSLSKTLSHAEALPLTPLSTDISDTEPLARGSPLTKRVQRCMSRSTRCTAENITFPAQTTYPQPGRTTRRSMIRKSNYLLSLQLYHHSRNTAALAPLERAAPVTQRSLRTYVVRVDARSRRKIFLLNLLILTSI